MNKGGIVMLSPKAIRIAKFILSVSSAGLTLMSRTNTDKSLDDRITKKITEELSKRF